MIKIVLVMAVATAAGVNAAKLRPRETDIAARALMDVVLWVLIPIVLFFNLARFHFTADIGAGLAVAYVASAVVVALAYLIGTRVLRAPRPTVGAIMCAALLGNTAYLGYPLVASTLGFDQLGNAVVYDIGVGVVGLLLVGFSIGAAFGTVAERPRDRVKTFFTRNPVLYAAAAALLAPDSWAPHWAVHDSRILVELILPLGFFAVGASLLHEAEEDALGFPPPLDGAVITAVVLKLVVVAGVLLVASATLLHVPRAWIIEAAMPTGINNLLLANNYGLDRRLAASAIVWSTLVVVAAGLAIEFL